MKVGIEKKVEGGTEEERGMDALKNKIGNEKERQRDRD